MITIVSYNVKRSTNVHVIYQTRNIFGTIYFLREMDTDDPVDSDSLKVSERGKSDKTVKDPKMRGWYKHTATGRNNPNGDNTQVNTRRVLGIQLGRSWSLILG